MAEKNEGGRLTQEQTAKLSSLGLALPRQRRQSGSVVKRGKHYSGQFWTYQTEPDGTEKRVHRTISIGLVNSMTKTDAKNRLLAIIRQQVSAAPSADAGMTLNQFWTDRYLPLKLRTWKESNRDHEIYMRTAYILKPLGHIPLNKLDKVVISKQLNILADAGYSKSVVKKFKTNISSLMEEAAEQIEGLRNSARKLQVPKTPTECKRRLTLEEVNDLIAEASWRDGLIVRLFFVIGLRPGEMNALRRNDVGTDPPLLRVDEANVPKFGITEPKTEGSKVSLYLPNSLAKDLFDWMGSMKDKRPEAFLFPSRVGTPIATHNFLQRNLKAIAKRVLDARRKAGLETPTGYLVGVTHQALRRTCATFAGSRGVGTVKDAQAILRHSTPDMTAEVYMSAIPASVKETLEAMDAKLQRKT